MADMGRHGPEHPTHLHTAFEDPEAQATTDVDARANGVDVDAPLRHDFDQPRILSHSQTSLTDNTTAASAAPLPRHLHHDITFPQRQHSQPLTSASHHHHHRHPQPSRHGGTTPPRPHPSRRSGPSSPYRPPSRSHSARLSTCSSPSTISVRRGPSRGLYTSPQGTLDGATLAAAVAAAPINRAPSHRSPPTSAYRGAGGGGGGLRRNESSNTLLNNIHPDILDDLRALDDLEGGSLLRPLLAQEGGGDGGGEGGGGGDGDGGGGGGGDGGGGDGGGGGHVDEAETYEVKELLEAKPRDVLQFIEEEGVVKLDEWEAADGLVLRAFGGEPFLVLGHEHAEPPELRDMWMERLGEGGRVQGTGWTSTLSVEAHVVNLYDAAGPGPAGLLRPLLARLRVHGCPPTVFALPAVQAVIAHKWNSWARHFLMAEFVFYALWLAAFSAFSLLLEDGADPVHAAAAGGGGGGGGGGGFRLFSSGGGAGEDDGEGGAYGGAAFSIPVIRMLASIVQAVTATLHAAPPLAGSDSATAATVSSSISGAISTPDGVCSARFLAFWDWGALAGLLRSPRGLAQLGASTAAV
ncbi:hypothetical protein Agub_g12684, partial [Astrephomene gubernaculifera]